MDCTLATVSDFAYVDRATGKIYVLGIVRYVMAKKVPARHERLAATFSLEDFTTNVKGQEIMVTLEVQDSDGEAIVPASPPFELKFVPIGPAASGRSSGTVTAEIGNLILPKFGDYAVLLRRPTGEVIARSQFSVQSPPIPPQP